MQDLLQAAGVTSVPGLVRPQRYFEVYTLDWATDIAAGASAEVDVEIERGTVFVIDQIALSVWTPAIALSAVALTPLVAAPSPTAASNTMAPLNAIRMTLNAQSYQMVRNGNGIRAHLLASINQQWAQFPLTKPIVPGGIRVSSKLFNDSAIAVRAQLALLGQTRRQ